MKGYIKLIEGNIIASKKFHYAQDWICYGSSEFNKREDLILNDTHRAIPYATYVAKGDIALYNLTGIPLDELESIINESDLVASFKHQAAVEYFRENIKKIKNKLKKQKTYQKI